MQPNTPPPTQLRRDRAWWVSLAIALLSTLANVYGVPMADPAVQSIVELVSQGLMGLSAAVAALRAVVVTRKAK